ncbi:MAG: spore coat protein U domain-containing protein [Deltaproteobacteria bacterium]|nr:spore coat protein U domain-containing protein [Deltaproteobacteria bacterium]
MRISALLAASLTTFGFASLAIADDSDSLVMSATVAESCTITGNTLAFGTYDTVSGAAVNNFAALSVACTSGTETAITLGEGNSAELTSAPEAPLRRMTDGTNFLSYQLYTDTNRTAVWGGTAATGKPYVAASSASSEQTVYGRIAANQDVPAGAYGDTVLATILF